MREIKFRQAIFVDGKFNSWHYWGFFKDGFVAPADVCLREAEKNSYQFIGRKDIKRTEEYPEGQEIYQGDIVNNAKGYSYIVVWGPDMKTNNPNYTGWVMRAPDIKGSDFGANELFEWSKGKVEVIGNIHQPELMEQNNDSKNPG